MLNALRIDYGDDPYLPHARGDQGTGEPEKDRRALPVPEHPFENRRALAQGARLERGVAVGVEVGVAVGVELGVGVGVGVADKPGLVTLLVSSVTAPTKASNLPVTAVVLTVVIEV